MKCTVPIFALACFAPFVLLGQLLIQVEGLIEMPSQVYLAIYHSEETFLSEQRYRQIVFSVAESSFSKEISLPNGIYAISLYQDINGNGELDRDLFGRPKEPYGFSGKQTPRYRAPHFHESAVKIEGPTTICIRLIR